MDTPREWLQGLKQRGIRLGLEHIRKALQDIEMPRHVIRVGGTNGKGSVCAFLGSILRQAGYDVGVNISPELERLNERITVNNVAINDRELERHAAQLMKQDVELTFFEAMTAIALMHFSGSVDIAILEVGMGGRCDATAAVEADVTVITNVSLEHMQHLGGTVKDIAREIAGAITGGVVVTACTGPALEVIRRRCRACDAALHVVSDDLWEHIEPRHFVVKSVHRYDLETRLAGAYQGQNIALAVKTAEILGIDPDSITGGIARAWLPGRLERIDDILLDAAHNPAAMHALRISLENMGIRPGCILFGVMRDKDIPGIIRELPPGDIVATGMPTPRAADVHALADMLRDAGRPCHVEENLGRALRRARDIAHDDIILVTGSLRLVGEIRGMLR